MPEFVKWVWPLIERGERGSLPNGILYLKGGDINEEICALMSRERLRKGSVSTWPVTTWLSDPYFAGKFVIDIRR